MKMKLFSLFLSFMCFLNMEAFCDNCKLDESQERIALIEENALAIGDETLYFYLAKHYYFDAKCYKKAMYWAFGGAEKGSSDCMLLLRKAYGEGFGVIQDTEDCLKWLVLAAAIGNEEAQKEVRTLEYPNYKLISLLPDSEARSLIREHEVQWKEVKKRAKAWADAHQSLFFSQH